MIKDKWIIPNEPLTPVGMTLRDYFAAAAMSGFCANLKSERFRDLLEGTAGGRNEALVCYTLADAMLEERSEQR